MAIYYDLLEMSERASLDLNIFCDTYTGSDRVMIMYGNDEYLALVAAPNGKVGENGETLYKLRLYSKDMRGAWDNVPEGFSEDEMCTKFFKDMKRASKVSQKRNSMWYIRKRLIDAFGDKIEMEEMASKGFSYKIRFKNGRTVTVSASKDMMLFDEEHDLRKIFVITNESGDASDFIFTADECVAALADICASTRYEILQLRDFIEDNNGKAIVSQSYRTPELDCDEVKGAFRNGYAVKVTATDKKPYVVELVGRENSVSYKIREKEFGDIETIEALIEKVATQPQFHAKTENA